ncbi:hypothetical protein KsCSTR_18870 [Candidatus Kuenenia stuttgartiensis]|uniref:Uncharacterized protein n=1 Tax=Kuenenia stuttgartiensis TaxID=174633 RepID=Q1Q2D6_KUEST|nr:hypothetical protein KsCSTR_18870 [Candidatus Kuenenia stuttgartiensis]CAJ74174.1 unknown protein [Candidatus Kuenenia stuttgartiensis]
MYSNIFFSHCHVKHCLTLLHPRWHSSQNQTSKMKKYEIRSTKYDTNSKIQNPNKKPGFEHLKIEN